MFVRKKEKQKMPTVSGSSGASDPRDPSKVTSSFHIRTGVAPATTHDGLGVTMAILAQMAISAESAKAAFLRKVNDKLISTGKSFYDYQVEALKKITESRIAKILQEKIIGNDRTRPQRLTKSSLIVSPTGSGKTTIFSSEILHDVNQGKKVLVLTHRDFLRGQIDARLKELCPDESAAKLINNKIQFIQGKKGENGLDNASATKPISIASVQTLSRYRDQLPEFFSEFDTIVMDEAHHYSAADYLATLDSVVNMIPVSRPLKIVGATATPLRHTPGVVPLKDIFPLGNIVWTRTMLQLIRDGKLKSPKGIRIETSLGEELRLDPETQNVNSKDMERLSRDPEFIDLLFNAYRDNCNVGNGKDAKKLKNAIFFAHDTHAADLLLEKAIKEKIPVAMVLGDRTVTVDPKTWEITTYSSEKDKFKQREQVFKEFGSKYKMLINVDVLTEAADLPQTQAVVQATLTRSIPKLQQMIGRGMRIDPKKPNDKTFDFIYIDPKTREKFAFANLATLGLEDLERIELEGRPGRMGGPPQEINPNWSATGTIEEGIFIDRPNPEWVKVLDQALRQTVENHPSFKDINEQQYADDPVTNWRMKKAEAINRLTQLIFMEQLTSLNLNDLVIGNDILFGAHASTHLKEAQHIFRGMLKILNLDLAEMTTRFPRLVGFEDFATLKDFMRELSPQRPENLTDFLFVTNENYGIDADLISKLYFETNDSTKPLAEIFDEIWQDCPSWEKTFDKVRAGIDADASLNGLTKAKVLNGLNKLLSTKIPGANPPEASLVDLESVRHFKAFALRHNLAGRLKGYTSFEPKFIERLELAVWLDQNQKDLNLNRLKGDRVDKLRSISMKQQIPKTSTAANLVDKLLKAEKELRLHGPLDRYESVAEHLKFMLEDIDPEIQWTKLAIPASLQTAPQIDKALRRIYDNSELDKYDPDVVKEIRSKCCDRSFATKLVEHLECVHLVTGLLKDRRVTDPSTPAQQQLSKMVKDLCSEQ